MSPRKKPAAHASCVIPAAVLKAVEVALSMALPKAANIHFTNRDSRKGTVRNGSRAMKTPRVVPFKTNEAIGSRLLGSLLEQGQKYGLTAVFPFSTDQIILAEWVHLKCRYGCSKYNTNWCCPPATPRPEKVRKIIDEYSNALLLTGTKSCA
jgi:hypothetical protein